MKLTKEQLIDLAYREASRMACSSQLTIEDGEEVHFQRWGTICRWGRGEATVGGGKVVKTVGEAVSALRKELQPACRDYRQRKKLGI